MQFFPVGKVYDFMGPRWYFIGLSALLVVVSLVMLVYPGPKLARTSRVAPRSKSPSRRQSLPIRSAPRSRRSGSRGRTSFASRTRRIPFHFLIRVQDVSTIGDDVQRAVEKRLCFEQAKTDACKQVPTEVKFSPGGEKITCASTRNPIWLSCAKHSVVSKASSCVRVTTTRRCRMPVTTAWRSRSWARATSSWGLFGSICPKKPRRRRPAHGVGRAEGRGAAA